MKIWIKIIIIPVIIVGFACEHAQNMYEPMLNMHGVVRNDFSTQQLILSRTYDIDEQEYFDLQDAKVIMTGGGLYDTLRWIMYNPQGGLFESHFSMILPRTKYKVTIYADGYDTLFGQTCTPGDFNIIKPVLGDTVNISDTIVFSASEGTREYQVVCMNNVGYYAYWLIWPSAQPESLFILPLAIFSGWVNSGDYTLMVLACDSNFFDYEYYYGDDYPQCGVKGGIGLFGSAWVKSVPVYLKVN